MDNSFLLRGLIMGFSIAAPVGPIGVLCIRRTLTEGQRAGLLTGLGAVSADAIYGCIAGFGLVFISDILVNQQIWLRLGGGVFLCYLGIRTFLATPQQQSTSTKGHGLLGAYVSTFLLTLTNPMTIMSFAAIFAGLGVGNGGGNYASAEQLVVGVFAGSALWWVILSSTMNLFRREFSSKSLRWVNRISGSVVTGFGLLALLGLLS